MTTMNQDRFADRLVIKAVRNIRKMQEIESDGERHGMYRPGIKLDLERSVLLTQSYRETEGQPIVIRRAKALEKILTNMSLYIQDWEKIVGNNVADPQGLYFAIESNWKSVKRLVESEEGRSLLTDDERLTLNELTGYWQGKSMSDIHRELFTGDILSYWDMKRGSPAFWSHWSELGVPNYEKIFRVGLRGIIRDAKSRLEDLDAEVPTDYVSQKQFLDAVVVALESVIRFSHRYADLALKQAQASREPEDVARLEKIADICTKVPERPPETFHEALQSFFLLHAVRTIEFSTLGIGVRFDKVFNEYLENDLRCDRIDSDEALELTQLLWLKFHELGIIYSPTLTSIYGGVASLQAITLGGVDDDGNDVTNRATYLALETARRMQTPEPTIALRVHGDTPDELLGEALEVVKTGIGYPSFFNDQAIRPLLERWDVPQEDAANYAISGCVYLEVPGKNMTRKAYGGIALPGALWYGLMQGRNILTGQQVGALTPDPLTFRDEYDVLDAYLTQVRFFFERLCTIENTSKSIYERHLPRPYYSALLDGCIEQGKDCREWIYPSPVSEFCVMIGVTNVADGITAIKKNVFEDKKVSMPELLDGLAANWEGHEDTQRLMQGAPKYGNDDDYADDVAVLVHHETARVMAEVKNRFGISCRGDGSGMSGTYAAGAWVPATPDGRKAGDPLADATLSPIFGMDREGPTAVLKSASKIDTAKTYNHLLNQKFLPGALEGAMKEKFIAYLKAWRDLGVSHVQFNIVDRETLIDAQKHPEEYPNLLVRVAGYSAYFVDLSKGLQDSIIARTEQTL